MLASMAEREQNRREASIRKLNKTQRYRDTELTQKYIFERKNLCTSVLE